MDVTNWLRQLGLDRYEAVFQENNVDPAVLRSMTAGDLKDLGIASVGHRRQLLEAIAALRTESSPAIDQADFALVPVVGTPARYHEPISIGERRLLSVMFCDVIGFTALSFRLDPEDLSAVIRGYQSRAALATARFGGFIARYVGDGILIYFGWPEGHESNAERAVRAALGVVDAVAGAPVLTETLQVRIGIATGLVVIGEPIGTGEARQQTAIGETPNLAARLQGLAAPNGVVIDALTHRQIGGLFEYRDLGLVQLKGLTDRVQAWQVVGEAAVESRFEAMHTGTMTPLVGRDEELELLSWRWRQATVGKGQLVLLSGEPGIGKSRLIVALEESLRGESHEKLRYFCSPHHQDSALYPIVARWEQDLRFARGDTPQERLHKLEAALAPTGISPEDIVLIADLLSLPVGDRHPTFDLNPESRKAKTFELLLRLLANRSRRQPLLMLFEDAHWADASTLELLDKTIGQLWDLPILLIVSFRTEFQPPWADRAFTSLITLQRLTQIQAAQLAGRIAVGPSLDPSLLDRIVTQTDGVPLFIEELTKAVLEDAERSDKNAATLKVPASLQASLTARLDRLPEAKRVAQIGAVIGRDFAHTLLIAVAKSPEAHLAYGISALVASGMAFQRGTPPDAVYSFKHALVRDAIYNTLLRSQQQTLHALTAGALEEGFPAIVDAQPELLGHHYAQAGIIERAIDFWCRAGRRSVGRSAHSEAGTHFTSALRLLAKLPPSDQRNAQELDLTLNLSVPLIAAHGFGALDVEECALRAMKLSDKLHAWPGRFAAHRLTWNCCLMREPIPKTIALARNLTRLANEDMDQARIAVAHRSLGYSLLIAGEFAEAGENLARGVELADTIPDREFAVYGEHPSMVCRAYYAQTKVLTGFPDMGLRLLEEAVAFARYGDDAHRLAWALGVAAHVLRLNHEVEATIRFATEAIDTAREHHWPQWLALGERSMGWAMHQLGNFNVGLNLQLEGTMRWKNTGAMLHSTDCELHLVESFFLEGRTVEARVHLHAARVHCANYGETYLAAEIDRWESLLLQSEQAVPAIVDEYLMKSLDIARRQGTRLLELRTATTFARILIDRGERARAADVLAPVYSWFTEGFGTTDLKNAKALLQELA
jgi:class 3 adenylate cyclase